MLFIMIFLLYPLVSKAGTNFEQGAQNLKNESLQIIEEYNPQAESIVQKHDSVQHIFHMKSPKQEKKYPNLLIFVSFSIPMTTLQSLAHEAQKVGGKLVFRGLVEGDFKKTALKFQELKREVLIDPTLFRDHEITHVPVFIREKGLQVDRIEGNVSLAYALDQFASKGET